MRTYPCPNCGEEVPTAEDAQRTYCYCCNTGLRVNRDAEFVDGMWRDLTSLTVDENTTNSPNP